ncbi:MAG: primosomal protein N', partial [Rhodothermales bacterium]
RGYVPLIECTNCGWAPQCPDCSVTMTVHRSRHQLRCHYCGRTARVPKFCPTCGSADMVLLGTGTQKVEEELETMFPASRVLRMDLDSTSGKNSHDKLLREFGDGKADILLGTQMVAKGLDFARVTLVGVINADIGMLLPDFRSEERIFQLLSQVAGRSGRAALRGEVIIQTRNPDRLVIRYARDHDYHAFAASALEERRQLGWPPYGRLAGIEFRGPEEDKVSDIARRFTEVLRSRIVGGDILGPEQAFIGRVKKQYRYHTIVRFRRGGGDLQKLLREVDEIFAERPRGYRINIDVDPIGLF